MPWVLKRVSIRKLEVDTMVGLETKYAVVFLSYNFIYVQNTVDIFL